MGLNTTELRRAWKDYECKADKLIELPFAGDVIKVAPPCKEAFEALAQVIKAHDYRVDRKTTSSYNCRPITGGKGYSLHSYGIAVDVNSAVNPWLDHAGTRKIRFSSMPTQAERAVDVIAGKADTDMTEAMIADIERIATRDGKPVFEWGGRWKGVKDAMHFEMDVEPGDLASGIDPATVRSSKYSAPAGGTIDALPAADREAKFNRADAFIIKIEGGYSNHKADNGGATNFGVTRATLSLWLKRRATVADVKALAFEEARKILKVLYWDRLSCDDMPGPLALAVYNTGVHAGVSPGAKHLQRTLNSLGASLAVDGEVGPRTLAAVRAANVTRAVKGVIALYEKRLRGHEDYPTFKIGWERRVVALRAECTDWIEDDRRAAAVETPKETDMFKELATQAFTGLLGKGFLTKAIVSIGGLFLGGIGLEAGGGDVPGVDLAASGDIKTIVLTIILMLLAKKLDYQVEKKDVAV